MRVHNHPAGDSVRRPKHDVSSFSRHARQTFPGLLCSHPSPISFCSGKILSAGCLAPIRSESHRRTLWHRDTSCKAFRRPGLPAHPCTERKESLKSEVETHFRASTHMSHFRKLHPASRGLPLHAWVPFPPREPPLRDWTSLLVLPPLILPEKTSSSMFFSSIS